MSPRLAVLVFILFLSQFAQAQPSNIIDSIQQLLRVKPLNDTTLVIEMVCLGEVYYNIKYDSAMHYWQKSEKICLIKLKEKKLSQRELFVYKSYLGRSWNNIAYIYQRQILNDSIAITYYEKALNLAVEAGNKTEEGKVLNNLATLYNHQGNTKKSLDYYHKSLLVREAIGEPEAIVLLLLNISRVYVLQGDLKKGEEYTEQALKISEQHQLRPSIQQSLLNKGHVLSSQKRNKEALLAYHKALHYGIGEYHPTIYNRMGIIYLASQQLDSALWAYEESLTILQKYPQPLTTFEAKLGLARVYLNLKMVNKAEKIALEIHTAPTKSIYIQTNLFSLLSEIYTAKKDYSNALAYFKKYIVLSDSVKNEDTQKATIRQQLQYSFDKKEAEAAQKRALEQAKEEQNRIRQQWIIMTVSSISLALLIFAGLIFRSLQINKRQKKVIEEQNIEVQSQNNKIQNALKEKELLIKEIHHRVKNNLQTISSLLELQSARTPDANIKNILQEGQNRVQSIALIHHKLYQQDNLTTIEINEFVNDLYRQIAALFSAQNKTIQKNFEIPTTYIDIDTAVPLGLIINELFTNVFKYAFQEGGEGQLSVSLSKPDENSYLLSVKDNGKGLPEGFDLKKSNTLGMRLVMGLSKQIGGKTTYTFDNGSLFEISWKKQIEE